jgi:putative ABC transport system permease protein
MSFVALIFSNIVARRFRAAITALAVGIGVTTVLALGVLTVSLRDTAAAVLRTGKADFTVAQKGVSDVLYSSVDERTVAAFRNDPDVSSAVGVLVTSAKLDADHPFFLEIGLPPEDQAAYGVHIVAGRAYGAHAANEIDLGYRAAADLGVGVGDTLTIENDRFIVVGLFSTGVDFGDAAAMFPLVPLQAAERKSGLVTLAFVQVRPGANVAAVRQRLERRHPQLATVRTQSDFGRIDRNLVLISAANVGGQLLAVFVGTVGVMATTLLSFVERIREFGLLRAVGWSRLRLISLVLGEALAVSLAGAALGLVLGVGAVELLRHTSQLRGVFQPTFPTSLFVRSLTLAGGMGLLGALYPALRAARLAPLAALRHE